ncbi:MAG: FtsX-like permease family protein [Oscillospiraceae bacterium]
MNTVLKYGILTNIRAKKRSLLFFSLIFILTQVLCLSVSTLASFSRMMDSCNENYLSVALLEYMGEDYPSADAADENARDLASTIDWAAIRALDGVESAEAVDRALGSLEGYERQSGELPYENAAVLVVRNPGTPTYRTELVPTQEDGQTKTIETQIPDSYIVTVDQVIYARADVAETFIIIETGDSGFVAQPGEKYLLHGAFVQSSSGIKHFSIQSFDQNSGETPFHVLDGENDPLLESGIFCEYAEKYRLSNNYISIEASADLQALEAFHQEELALAQGRFPEAGEAGVCVLDGITADKMGISPGETLEVELLRSGEDSLYTLTETGDSRRLAVVGVTTKSAAYSGCLWVSDGEGAFSTPLFGYLLGRVVLDNSKARAAAEQLQALLPQDIRVTLFDQGYSGVAQPVEAMITLSQVFTIASAVGVLSVLVLFAYLFIERQRDTIQAISCLGVAGRGRTLWALSGCFTVVGLGAAAGALASLLAMKNVSRLLYSASQSLYEVDERFSESLVGVRLSAAASDTTTLQFLPYVLLTALLILLCACGLCLLFLRSAPGRQPRQKTGERAAAPRVKKVRAPLWGRGVTRYAFLSAGRNGLRSALVAFCSALLVLFVVLLGENADRWKGQKEALYDSAVIEGQVVSGNGRYYSDLVVSSQTARALWNIGELSDLFVSTGWNYWLPGRMPGFADNAFGEEQRNAWIAKQPKLIALNDLSAASAFYYAEPELTMLEGWDIDFLSSRDYDCFARTLNRTDDSRRVFDCPTVYPVLVSKSFLTSEGLTLGQEFTLSFRWVNLNAEIQLHLLIVGVYGQTGHQDNIYLPLSFWFDPEWLTGETDQISDVKTPSRVNTPELMEDYIKTTATFSTCRFTLRSARSLDGFKSALTQAGFSQVGKTGRIRTTILLRDSAFSQTMREFDRSLLLGNSLVVLLFAAISILGFLISWLMINGRKRDFAVMRSLGTAKGLVFLVFFLEQLSLCVLGCVPVCLLLLLGNTALIRHWALVLIYLACYSLGTIFAIALINRSDLMTLLAAKE